MESWKDHSLILYDSIFFLLKNPSWTGYNTLISQNRAFIGIEAVLTNNSSYTIGYMNQYIFANPDQMNHIVTLTFNINNEHQNRRKSLAAASDKLAKAACQQRMARH